MSLDAMKLALEALEFLALETFVDLDKPFNVGPTRGREAITALRAAIEDAEKPWVKTYAGGQPHYTTPVDAVDISQEHVDGTAKREHEKKKWVGLTEDEVSQIIDAEIGFNSCWGPKEQFARAIETKLKEKNNA
jgi:hypothetical protein